jgi:hypothetical protein
VVQNHDNLVALIEQYAQSGNNGDIKQWASKMLPQFKQGQKESETLK